MPRPLKGRTPTLLPVVALFKWTTSVLPGRASGVRAVPSINVTAISSIKIEFGHPHVLNSTYPTLPVLEKATPSRDNFSFVDGLYPAGRMAENESSLLLFCSSAGKIGQTAISYCPRRQNRYVRSTD